MTEMNDLFERCGNRASFVRNKILEVNKSIVAVKERCTNARLSLDLYYEKMKMELMKTIDDHYHKQSEMIEKAKKDDLGHLGNLDNQLQADMRKLEDFLGKGKEAEDKEKIVVTNGDDISSKESQSVSLNEEIICTLEKLSKSHLEMPCLSLSLMVSFDDVKLASVMDSMKNCLNVSITGGLQITECVEMPGGILVKWDEHETDSESIDTDNSVTTFYTLQYASTGKQNHEDYDESSLVFNTLYMGEETQYFMPEVDTNIGLYFRVCKSYFEGEYGPWSLTKKAWTTLPHHEWNLDDCTNDAGITAYELGNKNRTATKVFPESCKVLRSSSSTYRLGHGINFKIDEAGERSSKDGIGLVTKRFNKSSGGLLIFSSDSFIVNTKGAIYVNGAAMVMMLPILKRGSILTFHTSRISPEKLRVTISIEDKAATFDWCTGCCDNEFLFAISFEHTGWQITVN